MALSIVMSFVMRRLPVLLLVLSWVLAAPPPAAAAGPAPVVPGTVCPLFPADNVWNTRVDGLPVSPSSATWLASTGASAGRRLHPDFGSAPYGIPFNVVHSSHATTNFTFDFWDESDPAVASRQPQGPYPYGPDLAVEAPTDSHLLTVDEDTCRLYETFATNAHGPGTAGSGAIFSLNSNALRPSGWTSADAAGLPILPGLLRRDEVAAGSVAHAVRFTVGTTDRSFLWPARHQAGSRSDPTLPPMGARFRLKASFDASSFGPQSQVVLAAFKQYGMILADNGSDWFFQGTTDAGWDAAPYQTMIAELKTVPASAFEAVDESSLMVAPDSGQARQPVDVAAQFHPVDPFRLFDTRLPGHSSLGPGGTVDIGVLGSGGAGGVPSSGVSAVVLNVTVTDGSARSYVTAYPAGGVVPRVSNVNFVPGQTVANLAQVTLGSGGTVTLYNSEGAVNVILDVLGWYDAGGSASPAGLYKPLATATRVLDSRPSAPWAAGESRDVSVAPAGVPVCAGAGSVVLNVTAVDASGPGYLSLRPKDGAGGTSNVNFPGGPPIANRVIVKLGTAGLVTVYNSGGSTNVLVDVVGWFTDGTDPAATGSRYHPLTPQRILDTRPGPSLGGNGWRSVPVSGLGGVPPGRASAVAVNLTVTDASQFSYISAAPAVPGGGGGPGTSDVNFGAGDTKANLGLVGLGPDGDFVVYNSQGSVQLLVDVAGWYG